MTAWLRSSVTWLGGRSMRGVRIDPQLHGRVTPRIADALEARGLRIHRVGGAAYVHDDVGELAIITAVLARRASRPRWVDTLDAGHRYLIGRGRPTRRQALRLEAIGQSWAGARTRDRLTGRYLGRPDWWQDDDGGPLAGFLAPTGRPPRARACRPWEGR